MWLLVVHATFENACATARCMFACIACMLAALLKTRNAVLSSLAGRNRRLALLLCPQAAPGCTLQLCWCPAALAAATALTSLGLLQHRMTPALWAALAGCTQLQVGCCGHMCMGSC
jgi:hypothetical protein